MAWYSYAVTTLQVRAVPPHLRPLHRQHQLHPRGRLQQPGLAPDPDPAVLLLAGLPAEQDTARRAVRSELRLF